MNEQAVIEQLANYKRIVARIKILEKYPIGNGITVSRLNQDDHLQELHRQLRGMPTYMYLNKREQRLETAAHTYMTKYPSGTKAQLGELTGASGADDEDEKLLLELRRKIEKVIEARTGEVGDYDAVIERISELQDLEQQKEQIDTALEALATYRPEYAEILRLIYTDGQGIENARTELRVSPRTFLRRKSDAEAEYTILAR